MTTKFDRAAAKAWADIHWCIPCEDGVVWTNRGPLQIDHAREKLNGPSSDWWPVFLQPKESEFQDWLFFIKRSWTVDRLQTVQFHQERVPEADLRVICTWHNQGSSLPGVPSGLNDCAHFVSECIRAGGIKVGSPGVPELVKELRKLGNTKTLANLVDKAAAKRMVLSGLVKIGDIIAYGGENDAYSPHGHRTVYMGGEAVANHTRLNHPDFSGLEGGKGNWERYTMPTRD